MTGTSPVTSLPPADLYGHASVHDRQNSRMGSPATLTLYGTPDKPQLSARTPDSFGGIRLTPRREDLIRFAREVLAFLGEDNGVKLPPWRPAVNGTGARPWFLARGYGTEGDSLPVDARYHFSAAGTLVRYASMEAAQRAADKLNEQETR